jgi:hypothetical protein
MFVWAGLTEIYLCHACSCQEMEDGNAPGQGWGARRMLGAERRQRAVHYCAATLGPPQRPDGGAKGRGTQNRRARRAPFAPAAGPPSRSRGEERAAWALARRRNRVSPTEKLQAAADVCAQLAGPVLKLVGGGAGRRGGGWRPRYLECVEVSGSTTRPHCLPGARHGMMAAGRRRGTPAWAALQQRHDSREAADRE